jgi:hypothetical protein
MTPPNPVPPLAPDELESSGGERQVLETFLDLYRDILMRKRAGLTGDQIRQRYVGHADILREQTDGATGFDG